MNNPKITLPISDGSITSYLTDALWQLAAEGPDLQVAGAPAEVWKPVVRAFYKAMRGVCPKFEEWKDKEEPSFWHTICKSGTDAKGLRVPQKCPSCAVLHNGVFIQIRQAERSQKAAA